jgi:hypothetical protein
VRTFHLDFNPYDADHRRVAEWLAAQPDPADAVVRLIKAAHEGQQRLAHWEELAARLANELHAVRSQIRGQSESEKEGSKPRVDEDPESARRLDSMFD